MTPKPVDAREEALKWPPRNWHKDYDALKQTAEAKLLNETLLKMAVGFGDTVPFCDACKQFDGTFVLLVSVEAMKKHAARVRRETLLEAAEEFRNHVASEGKWAARELERMIDTSGAAQEETTNVQSD